MPLALAIKRVRDGPQIGKAEGLAGHPRSGTKMACLTQTVSAPELPPDGLARGVLL
jgi:hypothetical protein